MTTRDAAKVIGISQVQVCHLIRKGVLKATEWLNEWDCPFYDITPAAARRCRDNRPKIGRKPNA